MSDTEARKRRAAERAVAYVESGMRLGLGTGSTVRHVLDVLGEKLDAGEITDIAGVATSTATGTYARRIGIALMDLVEDSRLDLTLDGADEFDPRLDLIKGLGGALLREKIVALASETVIIVVDESKRVDRLGRRAPLPVEVVPFGWRTQMPFLRDLGAEPALRADPQGSPFVSDGGNYIIDCRFRDGIRDVAMLEARLDARTGIVEHGLFLGLATHVVVAGARGVEVLERRAVWA